MISVMILHKHLSLQSTISDTKKKNWTVIWFQVFQSNTNNFQTYLIKSEWTRE